MEPWETLEVTGLYVEENPSNTALGYLPERQLASWQTIGGVSRHSNTCKRLREVFSWLCMGDSSRVERVLDVEENSCNLTVVCGGFSSETGHT